MQATTYVSEITSVTARWQLQLSTPTGTGHIGLSSVLRARGGLGQLADRQSGVVSRRQLRDSGVERRELDAALADGLWRAIGRVVVLNNAPLTPLQRGWCAVLLVAKACALAGLSGATSWGLRGFEPDDVHVLVPHDTHAALPGWVKVHESRRFRAEDIVRPPIGPPRTSKARSVLDAASWSPWPRRAAAILCAGVQQRLVRSVDLEVELSRAGAIKHAAIMRAVLGDIGGGGHTLAEIDLGPLAVAAGLSSPKRQVLRREPNGRTRYLDAVFVLPDGTTLVVEVDGSVHLDPAIADDDQDRQNEIVIGRSPVLRFSSLTVRLRPNHVVDQLRRMREAYTR